MSWSWWWCATAFVLVVTLGTLQSVTSRRWEFFFTFVFPFAVTTPIVLVYDTFHEIANPLFATAKLYSVLISAIFVWYIRRNPKTVWGRRLRVVSFVINILEAVVLEAQAGFWLNPLAGILLLVTMPRWRSLTVDGADRKLRWEGSLLWMLAYSVWNICFSINLYPALWFLNSFHVVLALVLCLRDPGWYAEIRGTSLNICFSLMIAFWPALDVLLSSDRALGFFSSATAHQHFVLAWAVSALLLTIGTVVEQWWTRKGQLAAWLGREVAEPGSAAA